MTNKLNLLKLIGPLLLALITLLLFILPVGAIGGTDIKLSSNGAGGPDIDISSDGTRLAVVYYKQDSASGGGAVYLKSATANGQGGWVTSAFVGFGSNPQVAFKRGVSNTVYIVWVNSDSTAIQSARCTLNLTTAATCTVGNNVRTLSVSNLGAPDLVVDGNNRLHVAWQNLDTIETAQATAVDSVTTWGAPVLPGLCAGSKAAEPALGWSSTSNLLHLAFLCGSSLNPLQSVEYRRSANTTSSHNWIVAAQESFGIGNNPTDEINPENIRLGNVALHASGSQIALAWDGLLTSPPAQEFSLMYVASSNQGDTWGNVIYVPSAGVLASAEPRTNNQNRLSAAGTTLPPQESGLRPNLVISATNNAAIVWQQKLNQGSCQDADNGSSDIHYIQSTGAVTETLEHTNKAHYSIDPDIAIGTSGVRHFVFMKDITAQSCSGGLAAAYGIYYRGPFTKQTNDRGEETAGLFLPIIFRN